MGYTKKCIKCEKIILSFYSNPFCSITCRLESEYNYPIRKIVLTAIELDGTVRNASKVLGVSYNWLMAFNRIHNLKRECRWQYDE